MYKHTVKLVAVCSLVICFLCACTLLEPTPQPGEAPESTSPGAIVDTTWEWQAFRDTAEEDNIDVTEPERYTLTLLPDGSAGIQADCNQARWTYTLEGNSLTFGTVGPTTLAMCPPDSLDQQYLGLLADTATWALDADGQLVLNPKADASDMIFAAAELIGGSTAESTQEPAQNSAEVTGTVTYRQRIALPDNAVLSVQLQDTSLADAAATVLGEQVYTTEGEQVPLPFVVAYDPDEIQEGLSYSLSARITDGAGNLLFINDTNIPVITRGNPTSEIEIVMVQVAGG